MNKRMSEWAIIGLIIFFTILIGQLLWGIIAIATVFWIFMLCDCLQRNTEDFPSKGDNEKLIWALVLIFLNFIGAVLYYYLVRMQGLDGYNRKG
ncbi:PLD nuclease N-terminal domain-containing protein [Methanococcoides burtonii]|uniref:Cardiolipin synthase N-terminal domain-containing protein n=1 Tax=Methanococcoides burtonii (strain DSM 6242 / NBRC 107633 / OCM 468 / ACE-M) TaxID=259564 RepID=Q12V04_METBU|nr:PLD nuclease N-terminal domain-containing protein [Methanococcoides burtonii]ABE52722.1 Hypothetical protein Mbur_1839 [Methanococcoides burtonii DSM 6242]